MKKCHQWTDRDDELLRQEIEKCGPIFEHFRNQGKSYSDMNAWDAVAGRLWDSIGVTGSACKRRYDKMKQEERTDRTDRWQETIDKVEAYERGLAETTFDGVSELLGNFDALFDKQHEVEKNMVLMFEGIVSMTKSISKIYDEIKAIKDMWK